MQARHTSALTTVIALLTLSLQATITKPLSLEERARLADAICVGTIGASTCFRSSDGGIRTQTTIEIVEPLKGNFPKTIYLNHRGGILDGMMERRSDMPQLSHGATQLLFLKQREDGTVFIHGASAGVFMARGAIGHLLVNQVRDLFADPSQLGVDLTHSAAAMPIRQASVVTDLLIFGNAPARFTQGDRGEPIGYLVDMDALPAGITTNSAMTALSNAFKAWADVTSLTFEHRGNVSFGRAAEDVASNDGLIRVQLHDTYDKVTGGMVLGFGGSLAFTDTGVGGTLNGDAFGKTARGFVMIEHTDATLSDPVALEEVLAHELGHVLGLAHSSETVGETDNNLSEALMYFLIHDDGRGAALGNFDRTTVSQSYPTNNTPPAAFDRILYAVSHVNQATNGPAPAVAGINDAEFAPFDLQSTNLTLQLVSTTTNFGTFSVEGLKVKYQVDGFRSGATADPLDNSRYDEATITFSDGTNLSATVKLLVKALMTDRFPANASDGLPDAWMNQFFGNADPSQIPGFSASGDPDGDGISNLDEFRIGTNPTDGSSALMFIPTTQNETLNFASTIGELYQIEVTTNFNSWILAALPVQATNTNTVVTNFLGNIGDLGFFRLQRVP